MTVQVIHGEARTFHAPTSSTPGRVRVDSMSGNETEPNFNGGAIEAPTGSCVIGEQQGRGPSITGFYNQMLRDPKGIGCGM